MTQRIFDIENEKDTQDLWDILPDNVNKIEKYPDGVIDPIAGFCVSSIHIPCRSLIKINWHDKTEITRPIQEATEQDIGKICLFYDRFDETDDDPDIYAILHKIENQHEITWYYTERGDIYSHCRRLTKQEIEELC